MSKVAVVVPAVVYKLNNSAFFQGNVVRMSKSVFSRSLETKGSLLRFLMGSYKNTPVKHESLLIEHSGSFLTTKTGRNGGCELMLPKEAPDPVAKIRIEETGDAVEMPYGCEVHDLSTSELIVSDVDDTLMISYASRPFRKLMTLLRVTPQKRRHVSAVVEYLKKHVQTDRPVVYLTNSEANLYPLIKIFLSKNDFPIGPLLMKPFMHRKSFKSGYRSTGHKQRVLNRLAEENTDCKFTLIGDTGQGDARVYGQFVKRFGDRVKAVYLHDIGSVQSKSSIHELDRACREKQINFRLFEAGDRL